MVTKAGAIREHFYEAYEHAKGQYSTVTARQVFYALREILNTEGINIDVAGGFLLTFRQRREEMLILRFRTHGGLEFVAAAKRHGVMVWKVRRTNSTLFSIDDKIDLGGDA